MDLSEVIGKIAGIIAVLAFIPYIWSVLKGRTRPSRASWLIWAVLGSSILASYHSSGATDTIWIPVIYAIMPIIIFLLSIKYGIGGYTRLDIICLLGAVVGLIAWKLTDSPQTALYLNILVDGLGFIPTFKKAYLQPESESRLAWIIGASATLLNLLAINTWKLDIALYPIYLAVFNTIVAILLIGIVQKRFKPSVVV